MHKLLVLYNEPKDPTHFRKYYVETHLPLTRKLPGLKASRYSFDVKPLRPGKAPYFCIFEAEFENEAALVLVAFDRPHCDLKVAILHGARNASSQSYMNFFDSRVIDETARILRLDAAARHDG